MQALWLACSRGDASGRTNLAKLEVAFSAQPCFRERLRLLEHVPSPFEQPQLDGPGGTHLLVALAIVRNSEVDFPLSTVSVLSAEQKAAVTALTSISCRSYQREQVYFWDIVDLLALPRPVAVVDGGCRRATVFQVVDASTSLALESLGEQGQAFLEKVGAVNPSSAMALPICLLRLALSHLVSSVPLTTPMAIRASSPLFAWKRRAPPNPMAVVAHHAEDIEEDAASLPGRQDHVAGLLESVADNLRNWRCMLLGDEEVQAEFALAIQTLSNLSMEFNSVTLRGQAKQGRGYRMEHLVRTVLLCAHLRNTSQLRLTIERCIALIFPGSAASSLVDLVRDEKNYPAPCPGTVSHARFVFDLGLLMLQRHDFERLLGGGEAARPLLFGMTDSSPVGGRNWQNTSFTLVRSGHVVEVLNGQADLWIWNCECICGSGVHLWILDCNVIYLRSDLS